MRISFKWAVLCATLTLVPCRLARIGQRGLSSVVVCYLMLKMWQV